MMSSCSSTNKKSHNHRIYLFITILIGLIIIYYFMIINKPDSTTRGTAHKIVKDLNLWLSMYYFLLGNAWNIFTSEYANTLEWRNKTPNIWVELDLIYNWYSSLRIRSLNAVFQWVACRDKKNYYNTQCNEIEEQEIYSTSSKK